MLLKPRIKFVGLFIAFIFSLLSSGAFAEYIKNKDTYEARAIHAFLLYCLPAITAGDDVERVAEMQKLPELSAAAETAFLRGQPGKVFGLPDVGGGIVLSAPKLPMCSILIQKIDQKEFMKQVDYWFDPIHTPFQIKEDNTLPNGEASRKYTATINKSDLLLMVSSRVEPISGGMQAMITVGRTNNP